MHRNALYAMTTHPRALCEMTYPPALYEMTSPRALLDHAYSCTSSPCNLCQTLVHKEYVRQHMQQREEVLKGAIVLLTLSSRS